MYCTHSLMDKVAVFGTVDLGSTPGGCTRQKIWTSPDFLLLVQAGTMFFHQKKQARRGRENSGLTKPELLVTTDRKTPIFLGFFTLYADRSYVFLARKTSEVRVHRKFCFEENKIIQDTYYVSTDI